MDKEATCQAAGSRHKECSVCGVTTVTEEIPKGEHVFGEWTVSTPATCTEEGEEQRVCEVCGEKETRVIEASGHDYESEITVPTCTEGGYTTHTCTVCGDSYTDSETEALGHTWDEGTVTKEPTADAEGEKTYTCTVCGETKTEVIEKLPDGGDDPDKPDDTEDSSGCGNCSAKAMDGSGIALMVTALCAAAFVLRRKK